MSGAWLQTYTGKKAEPLELRHAQVCIEDIAHALSNICRFGGHTRRFYSVAEHSVRMADELWAGRGTGMLSLAALLHDAPEAYLGDIPAPLKRHFFICPEDKGETFATYERRAMGAILVGLGLDGLLASWADLESKVKQADMRMLATEKRDLLGPEPEPRGKLPEPYDMDLADPMPSVRARDQFLFRYRMLVSDCGPEAREIES